MRIFTGFLCAFALCALASAQAADVNSSAAEPAHTEHPGEVALIQSGTDFAYKHFPTNLALYTFDKDTAGASNCNGECSYAWPPVTAPLNAKPIGDWTLVRRTDTRDQWAYKGKPVYVRFHDSIERPTGEGAEGGLWHVLKP